MIFYNIVLRMFAIWLDSCWLARRICRTNVGTVRCVRVQCLKPKRSRRRINLVEIDNHAYVMHLNLKPHEVRALVRTAMTAEKYNVNTARLIGSDASISAILRFGTTYVIYEYVEGRHPSYDCLMEDLTKIAKTYAQMHSATQLFPGRGENRCLTLNEYLSAWGTCIKDSGVESDLTKWLQRNRPEEPESYSLVHGDANRGNTIIKNDGQLVLIDIGSLHFGFSQFELVYLLLNYCSKDMTRRMRFVDVYRKHLGDLFVTWEKHAAFWMVGGYLERARYRYVQTKTYRRLGNYSLADAKFSHFKATVEYAHQVADLFQDGGGELRQVLDHCSETL